MNTSSKKILSAFLIWAFFLSVSHSQTASQISASQLTDQQALNSAGKAFYDHKYSEALSQYSFLATSSKTANKARLTYKMAECHFWMGDKVTALQMYRQAEAAAAKMNDISTMTDAKFKICRIQSMSQQYEEGFQKACEIQDINGSSPVALKACAYGSYCGYKVSQKRNLSLVEQLQYIRMSKRFKDEYSKSSFKHYLKKS